MIIPATRATGLLALLIVLSARPLYAQISLASAVDLALRNSSRVKTAQADLAHVQAALTEAKAVYVPSVVAGAGLGQAYGYSPNPPTLFFLNSSSLVFNGSQRDIIRSAHDGVNAASQSLDDTRESVAEDAALTFLALDHDQQREAILAQQSEYSARLITIVQDRFDAGRDSQLDLTSAKLSAAQLHLAVIRAQNETAIDRTRLARLLNLPPTTALRAEGGFPTATPDQTPSATPSPYANASVAAAFSNARAKQELAFSDTRYLYWPQVSTVIQYNRYATFTEAFRTLKTTYNKLSANEYVFGVQISIPLFDRVRKFHAYETAADAAHALHEAETAQFNALDSQSRLTHNLDELRARADVATLEQQLAQQQLDALLVQLNAPTTGPLMTPKDEQNSRIAERQRYLSVIDAAFDLHQAQINLLRQSGRLQDWLRTTPQP